MSNGPLIFVVAGEPSGDALGGRLMAALKSRTGDEVRFAGIGGPAMQNEGLESLFPMAELSVMGLIEVLPHARRLLRRMAEAARAVDEMRPDAVVTIDSPSFATGFVRRIRDRSIPRLHYVAPSVWAWRPWRVHKFKRRFDCILALLPFEPKWFERVGLECRFVGHPVIEYGADRGDGPGFRKQHDIPADAKVICVLPGSRRGEVKRLGPVFAKTLGRLAAKHPGLTAVVPSVPTVEGLVGHMIRDWPVPTVLVAGEAAKYDAMAASDLGLAASGTVAVELALAGVPSVIAYRVALVTAALAGLLLRVKFVSLINLILEVGAVPELLQLKCRPDKLARELERLFGPDGAAQIEIVQPALDALGRGHTPPSQRAAEAVLDVIQGRVRSTSS